MCYGVTMGFPTVTMPTHAELVDSLRALEKAAAEERTSHGFLGVPDSPTMFDAMVTVARGLVALSAERVEAGDSAGPNL